MNQFPQDFNTEAFKNSAYRKKNNCLSKYRQKIYDEFKNTDADIIEVEIDNDLLQDIIYPIPKSPGFVEAGLPKNIYESLAQELRLKGLDSKIITRIKSEVYIVNSENDPSALYIINNDDNLDTKTIIKKYLLVGLRGDQRVTNTDV